MRFFILILVRVAVSGALVYPCTETANLTPTNVTISTSVSGLGNNGYYYEVWTNSPGGPSNITLYEEDAGFHAQWTNPDDFLGRVGQRWTERTGQEYSTYGNMVAEYAYTRSAEGTAGHRYNFMGVYGWAYDNDAKGIPLVEYYIIDDWFGNDEFHETDPIPESTACHDSDPGWQCQKGSFTVDGAEYKIYTNWRVNKPSIIGDTTFLQYFSIRQQYRKCGKISISEHFKKWNSLNLRLGNLFEASLLVEVETGVGFVDYTHAKVLLNVSDADLDQPPVDYPPACADRLPIGNSCGDTRDAATNTPPCYLQPDKAKCDPSCPLDYQPGTGADAGKCVPKIYTEQDCRDRPVQRSGCKNGDYNDAFCAQFGCGPFCFLNARHTNCSLACGAGEVQVGKGQYCELAPCSSRVPRTAAPSSSSHSLSSSSHSLSNAVANYDVIISVKEVVFKFGWKSPDFVKIVLNGVTKTSVPLVGDSAIYTINEEFKWSGVTQAQLSNVAISVENPDWTVGGTTIGINDIAYKVGSISEGIEESFKFFDSDPHARYSNTFELKYKVAVIAPGWPCGLPTEASICYSEGDACVPACKASSTVDASTGTCVPGPSHPDGSYAHAQAVSWGGWALCLLIVVLFL